jgi:N-acetylmuramoyl-L-alanine amidase
MKRTALRHDFVLSPNVDERRDGLQPNLLILHYTGMRSAAIACDWLCSPQSRVSCHYLVDEAGAITQMVDEDLRAWHAGVSQWQNLTDINSRSIGIEIQNLGHQLGYSAFPARQMQAVIDLCTDILSRHDIQPRHVLAHSDIAPSRKIDPGELFNWRLLAGHGIGHWVAPEPLGGGPFLQAGDRGQAVEALQAMLRLYGYAIEPNGEFDAMTVSVMRAFQRHFRPEKVDGVADTSSVATLHRLLAALPPDQPLRQS